MASSRVPPSNVDDTMHPACRSEIRSFFRRRVWKHARWAQLRTVPRARPPGNIYFRDGGRGTNEKKEQLSFTRSNTKSRKGVQYIAPHSGYPAPGRGVNICSCRAVLVWSEDRVPEGKGPTHLCTSLWRLLAAFGARGPASSCRKKGRAETVLIECNNSTTDQ